MSKLLWSFTVKNPVKTDVTLASNNTESITTEKRRFGSKFKKTKFQLPECPIESTVFQVYLIKTDNDSLESESAQNIHRIVQSNYSVELVAVYYQKNSDNLNKKKIFTTTFQKSSVQYILLDKYNKNEGKLREMTESLNSLLFGLPLPGEPLWLTTNFDENNSDLLILQIRRGGRRSVNRHTTTAWTPYDAQILGQIPLRNNAEMDDSEDTIYNMMYQGTNQLMSIKAQVLQLQSQQLQLTQQLEEFLAMKEVSEAEMLEKMVMLLNKKKEKLEQLKRGVDIPDDDEIALYEFYSRVGEYNMLNVNENLESNNTCKRMGEKEEGSVECINESDKIILNNDCQQVTIKKEKGSNMRAEANNNNVLSEDKDDEIESVSTRSDETLDLSENEDYENKTLSASLLKRKRKAELFEGEEASKKNILTRESSFTDSDTD